MREHDNGKRISGEEALLAAGLLIGDRPLHYPSNRKSNALTTYENAVYSMRHGREPVSKRDTALILDFSTRAINQFERRAKRKLAAR